MSESQIPFADVQQRLPEVLPGNLVDVPIEELAESAINELHVPKFVLEECQSKWDKIFTLYSSSYVTNKELGSTTQNLSAHCFELDQHQPVVKDSSQSHSEKLSGGSQEEEHWVDDEEDSENDKASNLSGEESIDGDGTGDRTETEEKEKNMLSCHPSNLECVEKPREQMESNDGLTADFAKLEKEQQNPKNNLVDHEADQDEDEDNGTETETDDNYEDERLEFEESEKKKFINNWLQSSSFHTKSLPLNDASLPIANPLGTKPRWKPLDDFAQEMANIQRSLDFTLVNEPEIPTTDPNLPELEGWHSLAPEASAENDPREVTCISAEVPAVLEEISEILGDFVPIPVSPMNDESLAQEDFAHSASRGNADIASTPDDLGGYCFSFCTENMGTSRLPPQSTQEACGHARGNKTESRLNVDKGDIVDFRSAVIVNALVENSLNALSTELSSAWDPGSSDEAKDIGATTTTSAPQKQSTNEKSKHSVLSKKRNCVAACAESTTSPKQCRLQNSLRSVDSDSDSDELVLPTEAMEPTQSTASQPHRVTASRYLETSRKSSLSLRRKLPSFKSVKSRSFDASPRNSSSSKRNKSERCMPILPLHFRAKMDCKRRLQTLRPARNSPALEIICSSDSE